MRKLETTYRRERAEVNTSRARQAPISRSPPRHHVSVGIRGCRDTHRAERFGVEALDQDLSQSMSDARFAPRARRRQ